MGIFINSFQLLNTISHKRGAWTGPYFDSLGFLDFLVVAAQAMRNEELGLGVHLGLDSDIVNCPIRQSLLLFIQSLH